MAAVALVSVCTGLAEAAVLAVVVQAAATMSEATSKGVDIGPIRLADTPVRTLLIAGAVLTIARLLLQLVAAYLPARLSANRQSRLRLRVARRYLAASWPVQASQRDGQLQELVSNQVTRSTWTVTTLAAAIGAVCSFLALAFSALVLEPFVAATILVVVIVLFFGLRPFSQVTKRLSRRHARASQVMSTEIASLVALGEETRVFGVEAERLAKIERVNARVRKPHFRLLLVTRSLPAVYQAVTMSFVLGGLALLWALDSTELASLGAVVLILIRALGQSQAIQSAHQNAQELLPYLEIVDDALERFTVAAEPHGDATVERLGSVALQHVSFAYRADQPVLEDVNLTVHRGEAVGIIGPSGAGKSTIVQLLLGLRHPDEGRVLVDGHDLRSLAPGAWTTTTAFVPQDTKLLTATISENIRFFRPEVTDDDVVAAAIAAGIHDDIESWSDGYDTVVGQRADAVSGGQRQRLCLARALAGRPQLLVLDEPTSALDSHSEAVVRASLAALKGTVTLIVIAHRTTTLDMCDRVLTCDGGSLAAAPATAAS
jgi:ATP-binding cassette, subfamily B, bacterial